VPDQGYCTHQGGSDRWIQKNHELMISMGSLKKRERKFSSCAILSIMSVMLRASGLNLTLEEKPVSNCQIFHEIAKPESGYVCLLIWPLPTDQS
jgi:hypothetical protein